jgi:hypothetical protein
MRSCCSHLEGFLNASVIGQKFREALKVYWPPEASALSILSMLLGSEPVPVFFNGCRWSGHDRPCNTSMVLRRLTITKENRLGWSSAYVVADELPSELSAKAQN